jgi:hypothetical protein
MKRTLSLVILLGLFYCTTLYSQADVTSQLENMYKRLLVSYEDSTRLAINDSITFIIDGYVRSDSVFSNNFNGLRFLGQITSPDSRLKIVTWNLLLQNSPGLYFCYFVHKTGRENKIYKLIARYSEDPVISDTTYTENNWYGALYYDLRPVGKERNETYMLLGINYGNPQITRKIIDVLIFTPDGGITFGKKWFVSDDHVKYREVLEYSSTAVVTLRFVSDKKIVFDHLVPVNPALTGKREFYAPEFSYDAYNFENGEWKLSINEDIRNKKQD